MIALLLMFCCVYAASGGTSPYVTRINQLSGATAFSGRTLGSNCDDVPQFINDCPTFHKYCNDAASGGIMTYYCPRTCGLCQDQQPAEEIALCTSVTAEMCLRYPSIIGWCPITCKPFCHIQNKDDCGPGKCTAQCGIGYKYTVKYEGGVAYNDYEECNTGACKRQVCADDFQQPRKWDRDAKCCNTAFEGECGVPYLSGFTDRIVGGVNSHKTEIPWQAALIYANRFQCGGTVIDSKWVLTAAHCWPAGSIVDRLAVMTGHVDLSDEMIGQSTPNVDKVILHPNWKPYENVVDSDIALIKMKTPFTFDIHTRPACLPNGEDPPVSSTCIISGYGTGNANDPNTRTQRLQKARVETFSQKVCEHGYRKEPFLIQAMKANPEKLLCAGSLTGAFDSCFGDSGGPLVCQRQNSCNWFVAGVVSFGPDGKCGAAKLPGQYARVSHYEPWIKATMAANP